MSLTTPTDSNDNAPALPPAPAHDLPNAVANHRKANTFVESVEASGLPGWHVHLCKRGKSGKNQSPYLYWFSPSGNLFRSRPDVYRYLRYLNETDHNEDLAYPLYQRAAQPNFIGPLMEVYGMDHYRPRFKKFISTHPKHATKPKTAPRKKNKKSKNHKKSGIKIDHRNGVMVLDYPFNTGDMKDHIQLAHYLGVLDHIDTFDVQPYTRTHRRMDALRDQKIFNQQLRTLHDNPEFIVGFPFQQKIESQTFTGKIFKYMPNNKKWKVLMEHGEEMVLDAHQILIGIGNI